MATTHTTDSIVRIASLGIGGLILDGLTVEAVLQVLRSTNAPVTIRAKGFTTQALEQFAAVGGARITIDFTRAD